MKKIISCFFSILLFASLFGCNHKQTQATTLPAVYTLCAATSDHNMAETENGIYANYFGCYLCHLLPLKVLWLEMDIPFFQKSSVFMPISLSGIMLQMYSGHMELQYWSL